MNYQEKQEMKKLACKCLEKYFGFAPAMKQIVLLESASNGYTVDYLLFSIGYNGREFQLRRTYTLGKDTVEYKYYRYDVTMIEHKHNETKLQSTNLHNRRTERGKM